MSDLVRFGVAMDRALLAEFDKRIAARGYENRSEALRDLVRADLTRAAWDSGAAVAATLTVVYDNHVREVVSRIADQESGQMADEMRSVTSSKSDLEALSIVRLSAIPFYNGRPWFLPIVGLYYRLLDYVD